MPIKMKLFVLGAAVAALTLLAVPARVTAEGCPNCPHAKKGTCECQKGKDKDKAGGCPQHKDGAKCDCKDKGKCAHHKEGAKCECAKKGAKCECAKKGAKCECAKKGKECECAKKGGKCADCPHKAKPETSGKKPAPKK